MINISSFPEWSKLEESMDPYGPDWKEGGILFIKGLAFPDGMPRLYAGRVEKVWQKPGGPYMAKITSDGFYIILKEGYDYEAKKIGTSPKVLQVLGLTSHVIGLNSKTGKTPGWHDTVKEISFPKLLKEWAPVLDSWKDISYYPLSRTSINR